jgi:hypothetical protein
MQSSSFNFLFRDRKQMREFKFHVPFSSFRRHAFSVKFLPFPITSLTIASVSHSFPTLTSQNQEIRFECQAFRPPQAKAESASYVTTATL